MRNVGIVLMIIAVSIRIAGWIVGEDLLNGFIFMALLAIFFLNLDKNEENENR